MNLRFLLFGFPIAIQPFFFVTAWLIGPRASIEATLLWIPSVFVGVLAHELGHAFAGRRYGLDPVIVLHGFGGLTSWRAQTHLKTSQRILLSAAGPAVGITIGIATLAFASLFGATPGTLPTMLMTYTVWVNLGWGLLNLLPVLPLDGGHIAATAAEALFGKRGKLVALVLSLLFTGALAMWSIWQGAIWMTILAVILTVMNLQSLGGISKLMPKSRRQPPVHAEDSDAVRALDVARSMAAANRYDEALDWLETAARAGFTDGARLDADPAWAGLRNHPRYVAIRRSMMSSPPG